MSYTIVHGTVSRDPYFKPSDGSKGSFLSIPIESGVAGRKTWLDISLFGETADTHANAVQAGDWVLATGNVSLRKWESQDGKSGANIVLYANTFQKIDSVGAANNAVASVDDFSLADDF